MKIYSREGKERERREREREREREEGRDKQPASSCSDLAMKEKEGPKITSLGGNSLSRTVSKDETEIQTDSTKCMYRSQGKN